MTWQRICFAICLTLGGAVWSHSAAAEDEQPVVAPDQKVVSPDEKVDRSEPAPTKAAGPRVIVNVNLSAQNLHVQFPDGTEETWLISSGRPGYDTPDGKFKAQWVDPDHVSKQYQDAPMPYAVFFDLEGHAFHGSYQKKFGSAQSHGCVRLSVENAKKLYEAVRVSGADVTIVGRAPRGGEAVARRRVPRDYARAPEEAPYGYDRSGYGYQYRQPQPQPAYPGYSGYPSTYYNRPPQPQPYYWGQN